jgi:hypothetical protein
MRWSKRDKVAINPPCREKLPPFVGGHLLKPLRRNQDARFL